MEIRFKISMIHVDISSFVLDDIGAINTYPRRHVRKWIAEYLERTSPKEAA
jgi:hypothetical protein